MKISDADKILFRETVGPVKSLAKKKQRTLPPLDSAVRSTPKSHACFAKKNLPLEKLVEAFDVYSPIEPATGEMPIHFHRHGPSEKLLKQLRQGQLKYEGICDLHGCTLEQAKIRLVDFLELMHNKRVVLIIHGKGKTKGDSVPVLKNWLNQQLRCYHRVLAFCSAQAKDGGTGAVYVLLKLVK